MIEQKEMADARTVEEDMKTSTNMTWLNNRVAELETEVKRLREGMKMMLDDMKFSKPEEDIEYWLDTWKHWLKELIE